MPAAIYSMSTLLHVLVQGLPAPVTERIRILPHRQGGNALIRWFGP